MILKAIFLNHDRQCHQEKRLCDAKADARHQTSEKPRETRVLYNVGASLEDVSGGKTLRCGGLFADTHDLEGLIPRGQRPSDDASDSLLADG